MQLYLQTSHFKPSSFGILFNLIIGVFPMALRAFGNVFVLCCLSEKKYTSLSQEESSLLFC